MNAIAKQESKAIAHMPEQELMAVLQTSLYPGASIPSIKMVLSYCKATGLDPMQKPVHIVPMYDRVSGGMRDVIMPGVNLYRTQAMRGGDCAGVTEPEFGPDVTESIGGVATTYPTWCRVTVKRRLATGEIAEFTAREFWKENYVVKGGKEKSIAPNAMWAKRPYGQVSKCAEAQALRKAFPELAAAPTAEEMEGKTIHVEESHIEETGFDVVEALNAVEFAETLEVLEVIWADAGEKATKAKDRGGYAAVRQAYRERKAALSQVTDIEAKGQE